MSDNKTSNNNDNNKTNAKSNGNNNNGGYDAARQGTMPPYPHHHMMSMPPRAAPYPPHMNARGYPHNMMAMHPHHAFAPPPMPFSSSGNKKNSYKTPRSNTSAIKKGGIPVSQAMGKVRPPYVKKSSGVKWTKEEVSSGWSVCLVVFTRVFNVQCYSLTFILFSSLLHRTTHSVLPWRKMVPRIGRAFPNVFPIVPKCNVCIVGKKYSNLLSSRDLGQPKKIVKWWNWSRNMARKSGV